MWLVVFGDALFAALPAVYTNLSSRHYLFVFVILEVLIPRESVPGMYEQRHDEAWRTWWGRAFVVDSVSAPFFLGVFATYWPPGVESLLSLPGVVVGLAVIALTVAAGVGFLAMKIRRSLQRGVVDYNPRAIAAYFVFVVVTLDYLIAVRPDLGILALIPLTLVVASLAAVVGYLLALRGGRYTLASGAMPVFVFTFVTLVAIPVFPLADPATRLTVVDAIISVLPLSIMSVASVLLLPFVLIHFGILYSTFSGPIEIGESYS